MIPRYSRPEMTAVWSPETRFRIWFEIEAHACDALAELGVIPKEAAKAIWEKGGKAKFDVARIDEIERVTRHDVIAFLTHLGEFIGPDSRFVHQGMTSSDVLDTCLAVQLRRASDILIADVDALLAALKRRAYEHKLTPTIGRSHGVHAEPTTFGAQARARLCGVFPRPRAPRDRARRNFHLRDLGRGRHLRQHRSAGRGACRGEARPQGRAGLDPGDPARPACRLLRRARRGRLVGRAPRDRNPPSAAHRGSGGGGIFLRGAEGLLRHAAQAQSGPDREPDRPRPHGALGGRRRRWKMSRCGTSATSPIRRSSG